MMCSHTGQSDFFCSKCGMRLYWVCQGNNCARKMKYPDDKYCSGCGKVRESWVKE